MIEGSPEGVDFVWRLKDQLTKDEFEGAKEQIQAFMSSNPFIQNNVEIVSADRRRDAEMTTVLTHDQALERYLKEHVNEEDPAPIVSKHHRLMKEVGA